MVTEDKQKVFSSGDFRSLSDGQKRIFRAVVDNLDSRGMFQPTDVPVIASYARNVILSREASKAIEKYGVVIEEVDKYHGVKLKQNPAVVTLQMAQKAMEDTAIKLGLTPTGRKRLREMEGNAKTASEEWDEQND